MRFLQLKVFQKYSPSSEVAALVEIYTKERLKSQPPPANQTASPCILLNTCSSAAKPQHPTVSLCVSCVSVSAPSRSQGLSVWLAGHRSSSVRHCERTCSKIFAPSHTQYNAMSKREPSLAGWRARETRYCEEPCCWGNRQTDLSCPWFRELGMNEVQRGRSNLDSRILHPSEFFPLTRQLLLEINLLPGEWMSKS